MPRMTIEKLAEMVAKGFQEVLMEMRAGFTKLDARVAVLEDGQKGLKGNFDRLEVGQEDILLKLDNKPDKIDFPEKYPQYNSKLGR